MNKIVLNKPLTLFIGGPSMDDEIMSWVLEKHPGVSFFGKEPKKFPLGISWNYHPHDQIEAVKDLFNKAVGLWDEGPWYAITFSPFVVRAVDYHRKQLHLEDKVDMVYVTIDYPDYDIDKLINGFSTEYERTFKLEYVNEVADLDKVWRDFSSPMTETIKL